MAQSPKERKRAQRARDKEAAERRAAGGLITVTLQISEGQRVALENCARVRSLGRSPLSPADYIELLIAEDVLKLGRQLKELGETCCKKCGDPLPGDLAGCCHRGEAACWQTQGGRELALKTF
ncbi:hypothetical protein ABN36_18285 [Salmonella enterica subsp. enterica]|nr:hypothetical protein [Salmonella enterica subsp. enterica]EGI6509428.1 hypothetical protein [Salmonella enterica subsp. enterica serovar Durham]EJI2509715.1 hypothetical protein [Salmonella enterica]EJI5362873.1 hypothetical protein [Salmonella enterica]ELX5323343.1 hypothetical protein [Salmonella enterica]